MSEYNGWENYETYRMSLHLDGVGPEDFGFDTHMLDDDDYTGVEKLAYAIRKYMTKAVERDANGFALDIAQSFLAVVDWNEIAHHMIYSRITYEEYRMTIEPEEDEMEIDDELWDLDDEHDYVEVRARLNTLRKPINNRMSTLNRQAGIINRYRNQGLL